MFFFAGFKKKLPRGWVIARFSAPGVEVSHFLFARGGGDIRPFKNSPGVLRGGGDGQAWN